MSQRVRSNLGGSCLKHEPLQKRPVAQKQGVSPHEENKKSGFGCAKGEMERLGISFSVLKKKLSVEAKRVAGKDNEHCQPGSKGKKKNQGLRHRIKYRRRKKRIIGRNNLIKNHGGGGKKSKKGLKKWPEEAVESPERCAKNPQ